MQINFDLDEFIAYLLTGSLLLLAAANFFGDQSLSFIHSSLPASGSTGTVFQVTIYGATAFLAGHVSSVFTRNIVRPMMWKLVGGAPRNAPFMGNHNTLWNQSLKNQIALRYNALFEQATPPHGGGPAQEEQPWRYRVIRSYVLNNYPVTNKIRERIVRARSLCGFSVLPVFLFVVDALLECRWGTCGMFGIVLAALLWKQHDLDKREWKEIYLAFLAEPPQSNN